MRTSVLALALLVAAPSVASAHISLQYPLPRTTQQKDRHCGLAGSTRSANPTVLAPGETITVQWTETINHPGHYRISFDADGEDFTIPLSFTDLTQTENVLVDNITDNQGGTYSQEITLPDIECENCTLQLIQMMTDKPPYGEVAGEADDIYFLCADIALRVGGGPDAGPDPVGPDAGPGDPGGGDDDPAAATGGCASTRGGGIGSLVLAMAMALTLRRRLRGRGAH
jgi:hypothetical protein